MLRLAARYADRWDVSSIGIGRYRALAAEFERAYGPDGDWARLFRRDPAYLGTELLRGPDGHYLTLDRWRSRGAFEAFKARHGDDYAALDRRMEALTSHEASIGAFERSGPDV